MNQMQKEIAIQIYYLEKALKEKDEKKIKEIVLEIKKHQIQRLNYDLDLFLELTDFYRNFKLVALKLEFGFVAPIEEITKF